MLLDNGKCFSLVVGFSLRGSKRTETTVSRMARVQGRTTSQFPVELETLHTIHFSTLGQDESSFLSLSWGPAAEPRPDVSVIQRGEQRQLTCPSLWSHARSSGTYLSTGSIWFREEKRANQGEKRRKHVLFFGILHTRQNNIYVFINK